MKWIDHKDNNSEWEILSKAELEDGVTYEGNCRNASKAVWNAEKQRFIYMRFKFGDTFEEEINHPEDDDGYDVFKPFRKIS